MPNPPWHKQVNWPTFALGILAAAALVSVIYITFG